MFWKKKHGLKQRVVRCAIVVLLTVAALGGWAIWQDQKHGEHLEEMRRQQALDELRGKVNQFAAGHEAVTDWQMDLGSGVGGLTLYTADLQPRLIRADGRPVFFYGRVRDIKPYGRAYEIQFESKPRLLAVVDFDLICGADLGSHLLEHRSESLAEYAVIAHVDDLAIDDAHPREEGEKAFIAKGYCMDVMPMGMDGLSLAFLWRLAK